MDATEWEIRCAGRLHQQWPTIPVDELRETAARLAEDDRLRKSAPEEAATWWLQQGVLAS